MLGRSSGKLATMIGCLPTQAIAFEWKPGFILQLMKTIDDYTVSCNQMAAVTVVSGGVVW